MRRRNCFLSRRLPLDFGCRQSVGVPAGGPLIGPPTAPTSPAGGALDGANTQTQEPTICPNQPTPEEARQTKQALLISLLQRPQGASIAELVQATGWQNHSIRSAISFTLKKKLGLNVTSQRDEKRGRVYRIGRPAKASGTRTKKRS